MEGAAMMAQQAAEAAARRSYGKLVAFLAARTRDVAGAEDALADAFASALEAWPARGIPDNPEAWLLTAARRRLIDESRKRKTAEGAGEHLLLLEELASSDDEADAIPDDRLALMFACAHPAIDAGMRAPLMLQTILGFDAAAIGSAFLVAPSTMGQRLVRAKARIRQAGIPFRIPAQEELAARLDAVLNAIYAAYAEGWVDAAGTDVRRRNLAQEAIWLGRLVASLLPQSAEALGLLSLMLHSHARRKARRAADGAYVPLAEQDTALWDAALMDEAEAALQQASRMNTIGRFQLEAAVQSAHAVRRMSGSTDWAAIESLYEALATMSDSPVVQINRAVALAHTQGPQAGLALLDSLAGDARLADYQPYWAARAGLLAQMGAKDQADAAYERASGLERDEAVRRFLQGRRAALGTVT
ncbi:RNA polymerase subunit sigma-70 [Caenimonas koreensis DSM 17982]|uniref:RNA polymerase subunit sigma-70 n=2 Tax=Caenimonas TaxID=763439 RepID=A0A844AUY1_9BURK|nr:RNA polymerase subunit sigma-70 [Caenimonas koreensis DSM 17982]